MPGFVSTLLILGAMAGLGLLNPLLRHRANLKAKDWPATPGEVVLFERRRVDGMRGEVCDLQLRYRYTVGGREYFAHRLWFATGWGCFDPHIPELAAGQRIPVAYDPERPRTAVLVRSHPLHQGDYVLVAICVLPAVALLLFGLRKRRPPPVDASPQALLAAEPGAAAGGGQDNA